MILLIVGMFMDPNSAVVLFAPLLWPIAQHAGVDLIHFGIIFTVNLAIGMFSPPFGLNIFVSCSIFKVSSSRVVSGLMPFFVAYLIALVIITYMPAAVAVPAEPDDELGRIFLTRTRWQRGPNDDRGRARAEDRGRHYGRNNRDNCREATVRTRHPDGSMSVTTKRRCN